MDKLRKGIDNLKQKYRFYSPDKGQIEDDDFVIYKDTGKYKGTIGANYKSHIRNANRIVDFRDFNNHEDIIDYLDRYQPGKYKYLVMPDYYNPGANVPSKDRPLTPSEIKKLGEIRQDYPDNTSDDLDELAKEFGVDRDYLGKIWENQFTKTIK